MAAVSFAHDIVPLFKKDTDVPHMADLGVPLTDYAYMSDPDNAQNVLDHLTGAKRPAMPPPPAARWPAAWIDLFKSWMAGGYQP
ncbi:MAG TPA: hypothetical protein VGF50_08620 [Caulobacteraceae bacterium]|jgi:hypothetical protein